MVENVGEQGRGVAQLSRNCCRVLLGITVVVGPFVAGGLTELVSWRWAFLFLVQLVPVPMMAVLPRISPGRSDVRRPGRVQLAAAMAGGAARLQWAGLEAENRRWLTAILGAAVGIALVVVAAVRLFPAGTLWLRRGLPSVVAFRGVMAGGFFGCQAYVPLMLVEHRGATPTMAGLAVAGTALGWSTGSWWQGRPTSRRRSSLVRIGSSVAAAGVLVTSAAAVVTDAVVVPAWVAGVGLVIGGLGMGLSMASNAVLLFDLSPVEDRGANSAAIQMSDSLGGLLVFEGELLSAPWPGGLTVGGGEGGLWDVRTVQRRVGDDEVEREGGGGGELREAALLEEGEGQAEARDGDRVRVDVGAEDRVESLVGRLPRVEAGLSSA